MQQLVSRTEIVSDSEENGASTILLLGLPNSGKTSLFNRLSGSRAHTANFPGTTVEIRKSGLTIGDQAVDLIDLPGLYGLDELPNGLASDSLTSMLSEQDAPKNHIIVVVIDATRIPHQLPLAGELRSLGRPVVVALNMIDEVRIRNLQLNLSTLESELGAPVVPISARSGEGVSDLIKLLADELVKREHTRAIPSSLVECIRCNGCSITARCRWADRVAEQVYNGPTPASGPWTEFLDRHLLNPRIGIPLFAAVLFALFLSVFVVAAYPMEAIDQLFGGLAALTSNLPLPAWITSLLANGVIAGVGSVLVFIPQIFILFFAISLLEDSGYLARSVAAADRSLRKIGLPGQAFIPMLSAHACAIPAILSTRIIDNPRDRLRTILITPLLTCSARLPVYLMVAALLFTGQPVAAALLVVSGYALGALAAILFAYILKRTVVPGDPELLAIELPPFRRPSLKVALYSALDRGVIFLRQAGGLILLISLAMWALSRFPELPTVIEQEQKALCADMAAPQQTSCLGQIDRIRIEHSLVGRLGKTLEPIFAPLGFDWRITIGILSSFAAREVVVSVLSIVGGVSTELEESSDVGLISSLQRLSREDGAPLFDVPTSLSLLVFFVLAMQCLPTQAATYQETKSWKWPALQFTYMTCLAYGCAWFTFVVSSGLLLG